MFLYNSPGRSIVDINIDTMVRLRKACPNIVGVKDATADMARMSLQRHYLDDDFVHLTGDDASALGFMAHGGQGCISVTSNIAPKLCNQMQEACLSGDFAKALAVQDKLAPLHTALFKDPNPVPVKYVASLLGLCESDVRLPLVSISQSTKAAVDAALEHAGLV
ncbi:MAG: 4-hydroxy-tetrahydrodipicolinate synthase [Maritalea sp.]|jgi:4-hydroxy-tetrahydrodipicolinate synthase